MVHMLLIQDPVLVNILRTNSAIVLKCPPIALIQDHALNVILMSRRGEVFAGLRDVKSI